MQAFVQFCVLVTVTMAVVYAIVKKVTKVLNVKSQQENVKCRVALDMDVALKANAIVNAVSKEMTAPNVSVTTPISHPRKFCRSVVKDDIYISFTVLQLIVSIQRAPDMAHALMDNVTVSTTDYSKLLWIISVSWTLDES